ncbi:hypothetical protein JOE11_000095 [Robbsia andropogonis]
MIVRRWRFETIKAIAPTAGSAHAVPRRWRHASALPVMEELRNGCRTKESAAVRNQ